MSSSPNNDQSTKPYVAHPGVRIGHVHLKVSNLERSIEFYFGLNTWESLGGDPPPSGATGLYHTAIVYPTRPELAAALRRVLAAKIPLEGAADHGVSEAIYLRDPDDNGVELYWDRPRDFWPHDVKGNLAMYTRRLDLESLLSEPAPVPAPSTGPLDL
jgi:catechol 2,3-dioxygenase